MGSSSWGSVEDGAFLTWTCGLCGLLHWPMDYVSFSLVPEDNPTALDDNIPHLDAQYHGWACGKTLQTDQISVSNNQTTDQGPQAESDFTEWGVRNMCGLKHSSIQ